MKPPAIIVAGLGRCGSSATMHMLQAAGVPCVGVPPSFEDERTHPLTFDYGLFATGHAIKILDPHRLPRPIPAEGVRSLFLVRDHKEQALSQIKFCELVAGLPRVERAHRMRWAAALREEERRSIKALPLPVTILTFAEFCRNPRAYAERLRSALAGMHDLDVEKMLRIVRRRKAFDRCEPGVDIEVAVSEAAERSPA